MTTSRQSDTWPPGRKAVEEAAEWMAEAADGELDVERRQGFSRWLRRSPENIAAYIEVAAFWSDVPQAAPPGGYDIAQLVAEARAEGNVVALGEGTMEAVQPRPEQRGLFSRRSFALAAAVLLALGTIVWGIDQWRGPAYATEIGEQRSLTLADGSTVQMNARSRIRVRFADDQRVVSLENGQALFSVAKDSARPFVVRSGETEVRAVGTQFDVDRKTTGTTVTVLEGRVAVGAGPDQPAVQVPAGQQISVQMAQVTKPEAVDVAAAIAWTERRLVFQATPLGEVVEGFNRFSTRPLVVRDEELASLEISGVYASTDPDSLIRFLRGLPGVQVDETERQISITRQ